MRECKKCPTVEWNLEHLMSAKTCFSLSLSVLLVNSCYNRHVRVHLVRQHSKRGNHAPVGKTWVLTVIHFFTSKHYQHLLLILKLRQRTPSRQGCCRVTCVQPKSWHRLDWPSGTITLLSLTADVTSVPISRYPLKHLGKDKGKGLRSWNGNF